MTPSPLKLVLSLAAFFFTSLVLQALNALYFDMRDAGRYKMATFIGFIHDVVGWAVSIFLFVELQNNDKGLSALEALSCCLGGATGTFYILRRNCRADA